MENASGDQFLKNYFKSCVHLISSPGTVLLNEDTTNRTQPLSLKGLQSGARSKEMTGLSNTMR